ncbi:hypothetical protein RZQ20_22130 [Raoultella ornithinolytica]|uniref:hypothetical protein n=1 Tax=Raoultella ornithinolytica TaxID=54291 RepID=UPI00292C1EB1|nr:hypothetical protein [Raoultella ornithinolytica]MDV1094966.1 hypothetical protein [Raoultella ornithinolytica]MDV1122690.1 hypothetical protein [Raoultella ornithinolytica]MDV1893205.1 hypothetical protein [Raoultella ornithinolytica]
MSLFQCDNCGCCENTALSSQGFKGVFAQMFDWRYAPERKGKKLCSACGPTHYRDGRKTEYGQWHDVFPRVFLPKGMFYTNDLGNLAHRLTGSEDYQCWALKAEHEDVGNTPFGNFV